MTNVEQKNIYIYIFFFPNQAGDLYFHTNHCFHDPDTISESFDWHAYKELYVGF